MRAGLWQARPARAPPSCKWNMASTGGGIAQEPEGPPRPARGPGHLGPGDIETIIDDGCDNRRHPLTPVTPFLPCPHHNGGAGKGYVRQWLAPVDPPSLPALRRPGFRSDWSTAVWISSRSASCPYQQVRGSSQTLKTSSTRTSPRPVNTSPGFPSHTSSGGLRTGSPWSAAHRRHHQSGQPGSADKPRPTGRCRNRRVCNPSGCREATNVTAKSCHGPGRRS